MKNEHQIWMEQKQKEVRIVLSPSKSDYRQIRREYKYLTDSDNPYDDLDLYESIERKYKKQVTLNDISLKECQAFAEPIRIANPDQCVSLYADNNSFIGNTSWNDQLKMFFDYPTYTEIGKSFMDKRRAEAKEEGTISSYE